MEPKPKKKKRFTSEDELYQTDTWMVKFARPPIPGHFYSISFPPLLFVLVEAEELGGTTETVVVWSCGGCREMTICHSRGPNPPAACAFLHRSQRIRRMVATLHGQEDSPPQYGQ